MTLSAVELELVQSALRSRCGAACTVNRASAVSGGDINRCYLLETSGGSYFAKLNSPCKREFFEAERDALLAIAASNTIRVPEVIDCTGDLHSSALMLEYLAGLKVFDTASFLLQDAVEHYFTLDCPLICHDCSRD